MKSGDESRRVPLDQVLGRMQWRYSVRKYDKGRKIPDDVWARLEEALILSPSSCGLQPWKFIVVTSDEAKRDLYPMSYNQPPVTDASHLVIFAARDELSVDDIAEWCDHVRKLRGRSEDDFRGHRDALVREMHSGYRRHDLFAWASEQAHIALGTFMTCCAMAGIDTSPMGGIKPKEIDAYLGLGAERFRTVVLCAAGYRHPDDAGTGGKKTRFPSSVVIRRVG